MYVLWGYQLNKGVSLLGKVAGICVCWIPTKQGSFCLARLLEYVCVVRIPTKQGSLFAWQGCWYMCVLDTN